MNQRTDQPLNIAFVQAVPCIRNYKMASALRARGHSVTLLYNKCRLSDMYPDLSDDVYDECIQFTCLQGLWSPLERFDIAHCHNQPDNLTVAALAGAAPVIHDTHDLISLRADWPDEERSRVEFFEGVANRAAQGRVYSTPYQQAAARELYGVTGESLVLYNYVSAGDLSDERLAKLSESDGKVHIVYEGGISNTSYRDFGGLFVELAKRDICVHIYPTSYNEQLAGAFGDCPNVHYNRPVSPRTIIREMTQFDIGIIPFNFQQGNRTFLDSTIANKLFEYLAAGLPVLASPLRSYVDYFEANPVGAVFDSADELASLLPRMKEISAATDWSQQVFTYESEIRRLEAFYRWVISHHELPGVAETSAAAPPQAGPAPTADEEPSAGGDEAGPAQPTRDAAIDTSDAEAAVDGMFRQALRRQFATGRAPLNPSGAADGSA